MSNGTTKLTHVELYCLACGEKFLARVEVLRIKQYCPDCLEKHRQEKASRRRYADRGGALREFRGATQRGLPEVCQLLGLKRHQVLYAEQKALRKLRTPRHRLEVRELLRHTAWPQAVEWLEWMEGSVRRWGELAVLLAEDGQMEEAAEVLGLSARMAALLARGQQAMEG